MTATTGRLAKLEAYIARLPVESVPMTRAERKARILELMTKGIMEQANPAEALYSIRVGRVLDGRFGELSARFVTGMTDADYEAFASQIRAKMATEEVD